MCDPWQYIIIVETKMYNNKVDSNNNNNNNHYLLIKAVINQYHNNTVHLYNVHCIVTGAQVPPSYNSSVQRIGTGNSRNMTTQMTHTNGDLNGDSHSFYTRHSRHVPDYSPPVAASMNGHSHSPDENAHLTVERQSISSEMTTDSGLPTDRHSASSSPTFDHPGELQVITVTQNHGLGLCIIGGTNRPDGPLVYIDDIIEGGDAHKVCKLWSSVHQSGGYESSQCKGRSL